MLDHTLSFTHRFGRIDIGVFKQKASSVATVASSGANMSGNTESGSSASASPPAPPPPVEVISSSSINNNLSLSPSPSPSDGTHHHSHPSVPPTSSNPSRLGSSSSGLHTSHPPLQSQSHPGSGSGSGSTNDMRQPPWTDPFYLPIYMSTYVNRENVDWVDWVD